MTDDRIVKDSARDPEREALGSTRGGIRAAAGRAARKVAKKVVKKVAKKAAQKKTAKKAAAAAGKTTKKTARSAAKPDKSASGRSLRLCDQDHCRQGAGHEEPGLPAPGPRRPRPGQPALPRRPQPPPVAATEHGAGAGAVPLHDSGPAIEAPPPPAPMHPGAAMESMQEHAGGLGSLLALWGPLIIVGFLVLVFRGGEERESTVATGSDAPSSGGNGPGARDVARNARRGKDESGRRSPGPGASGRQSGRCERGGLPRHSTAGSRCGPRWRVNRSSQAASAGPGCRRARPGGSIRHRPAPIAIRDTEACPPARAGPRTRAANGCGRPKVVRARCRTTAAAHPCSGCNARRPTTGVRLRAALPGSGPSFRRRGRRSLASPACAGPRLDSLRRRHLYD